MFSPDESSCLFEKKQQIREKARRMRKELNLTEKSKMDQEIFGRLFQMPEILTAKIVYLYASFEYEADTWEILKALWKRQIMVASPRTEGNELFFCLVDKPEELIPGSFGIWEPKKDCQSAKGIDFKCPVVLPGLAFSRQGERVGYGGGYYDRFLEKESEHVLIGIGYPFQVLEKIDTESHDQKVHWVITSDEVIDCSGVNGC